MTHHRREGSKTGSATKASWLDPVIRKRRLDAIAAGRHSAEPIRRYITEAVRVSSIPRDAVELELFGEAR